MTLRMSSLPSHVAALEEEDFLKEILEEEQREAEELAKLEAEMKELDEMKAQQEQMRQQKYGSEGMGGKKNKMPGTANTNANLHNIEEEFRKKETMGEEEKKEAIIKAQEQVEKEKAQKIAQEREAAFQAEVARAKDEKTKKDLKQQKAKDTKMVAKILKNSERGNHYAVLGFRCQWGEIRIGPFKLCSPKGGEIKKAYRSMARLIHPDKNRDGRAGQAFDALEKSSAILLDEKTRKEYDTKLRLNRKGSLDKSMVFLDDSFNTFIKVLSTLKAILGPFSTPIIVLLALII